MGSPLRLKATAPMLPVALHFLLQDVKIQRLIIETSGMGHPARLIDTIRANYAGRLDMRATLGIVTPLIVEACQGLGLCTRKPRVVMRVVPSPLHGRPNSTGLSMRRREEMIEICLLCPAERRSVHFKIYH